MSAGRIFDIFSGIVSVAMVSVIVSSKNLAGIIQAFGNLFSGSLKAAMGNG